MKGMNVETKDTKIDNLNETVLQLKNVLSMQSGNISDLEAGLNREIGSLQLSALTLNETIQRETIKSEKTIKDVKKQLTDEIENHDFNISDLRKEYLWLKKKFNTLQQNGSIINKMIQEEKIRRKNFTKQLTLEQISQNAHIYDLRGEAIGQDRNVKFLQKNVSTLSKTIQNERIERENDIKQLTLEIASQNRRISYLQDESTILKWRVATIKKLLLLTLNISELFQETANNSKVIWDDSDNIEKQVNVLRQKQMELDHVNNIVQQNLTELFNKTVMLNKKMKLIQQNDSTPNKMIQQEKIERENVTKQLKFAIANQNTKMSYLHEESTRLNRRVKLLQQCFTDVKKGIEVEKLQREKSLHNVTKQLRQSMANQNVATTKEIWLLTLNVTKLFQETIINRKLLRHESYNITKQVNFLRQKHTTLDQNLTQLLKETLSLKATDYSFQIKLKALSNITTTLHLLKQNINHLDQQSTICSRNIFRVNTSLLDVNRYLISSMGMSISIFNISLHYYSRIPQILQCPLNHK